MWFFGVLKYAKINLIRRQSGRLSSKGGLPMGKSDNHISHPPEGTPRPSLFGSSTAADGHNIFDSLEEGRAKASTPNSPRRLLWLLAPLVVLVGWVATTQLQKPPESRTEVRVAVAADAPVATIATATPKAPAKAELAGDPFTSLQAAAIAQVPPTAPPNNQTEPAFNMQAALEKPSKPTATDAETLSKVAKEPVKPPVKSTETKPAPIKASVQKAPPSGEAKTVAKTTSSTVNRPSASDPDVELLSAIMKHLGDERGSANASTRSSQTIAQLVKSCQGNDPIDTLLCQRRICEGSWGKAQACPMNLAPKQTARAEASQANN